MRLGTELFKKIPKEKSPAQFFKFCFHQSKSFLVNNKSILIKWFLFDLCIGLFLSVGIAVDSQRSLLYFLVAVILYLIINIKTLNIERGFYWTLTTLFVINTSFLINIYIGLNYLFAYLIMFFLIRVCILLSLKKLPSKKRPSDFFKYYLYKSKLSLKKLANKTKLLDVSYYFYEFKSFLINNNFLLIRQFLI